MTSEQKNRRERRIKSGERFQYKCFNSLRNNTLRLEYQVMALRTQIKQGNTEKCAYDKNALEQDSVRFAACRRKIANLQTDLNQMGREHKEIINWFNHNSPFNKRIELTRKLVAIADNMEAHLVTINHHNDLLNQLQPSIDKLRELRQLQEKIRQWTKIRVVVMEELYVNGAELKMAIRGRGLMMERHQKVMAMQMPRNLSAASPEQQERLQNLDQMIEQHPQDTNLRRTRRNQRRRIFQKGRRRGKRSDNPEGPRTCAITLMMAEPGEKLYEIHPGTRRKKGCQAGIDEAVQIIEQEYLIKPMEELSVNGIINCPCSKLKTDRHNRLVSKENGGGFTNERCNKPIDVYDLAFSIRSERQEVLDRVVQKQFQIWRHQMVRQGGQLCPLCVEPATFTHDNCRDGIIILGMDNCPTCLTNSCMDCQGVYYTVVDGMETVDEATTHRGRTCDVMRALLRNDIDAAAKAVLDEAGIVTKQCPRCGERNTKNMNHCNVTHCHCNLVTEEELRDGCQEVLFCWLCECDLTRHPYNHFRNGPYGRLCHGPDWTPDDRPADSDSDED